MTRWRPIFVLPALLLLSGCSSGESPGESAGPALVHLSDLLGSAEFKSLSVPQRETPARGRRFLFDSGPEGWIPSGPIALDAADGRLGIRGNLSQGLVLSPELNLPWIDLKELVIRVQSTSDLRIRVFWAESEQEFLKFWQGTGPITIAERRHRFRSAEISVPASEDFLPVRISMRNLEFLGWESLREKPAVLRRLILHFWGDAGTEVGIDEIGLLTFSELLEERDFGTATEIIAGVARHSIFLNAPGRLRLEIPALRGSELEMYLSVPDGRGEIEFGVEAPSGTVHLRRSFPAGPEWHPISLPLPETETALREIVFTVRGEAGTAFLGSPVLVKSSGTAASPRLIFYLMDTLGARHLGSYGYDYDTSPTLDRIAAGGALFQDCIAQSSWTRPSTVSILTGLYPPTHGVIAWWDRLSPGVETLAQMFRERGFFTISFITNPHAGISAGLDKGFDVVFETPAVTGPLLEGRNTDVGSQLLTSGTSLMINEQFLPWLRDHADWPAFIYLHSLDPHFPYSPPPPFENGIGPAIEVTTSTNPTLDRKRTLYDGDVAFNDRQIGRILDLLKILGIKEETFLLVTSDHGEEFGEHGQAGHRNHLHGEVTHVPLILHYPGRIPAGLRIPDRVETIDIFPTLLEYFGIPIPPSVQGRSLAPLIGRGTLPARPAYSHLVRQAIADNRDHLRSGPLRGEFARWEGPWLFLHGDYSPLEPPWNRLYHLERDPLERKDVASQNPELVDRFREQLEGWYGEQNRIRGTWQRADRQIWHDEEAERRLRALGYLQ